MSDNEAAMLRKKSSEAFLSGEPVYAGKPIDYFARMTPYEMFAYTNKHPDFKKTWVYKSILQDRGPVYNMIAKTGSDKRR